MAEIRVEENKAGFAGIKTVETQCFASLHYLFIDFTSFPAFRHPFRRPEASLEDFRLSFQPKHIRL